MSSDKNNFASKCHQFILIRLRNIKNILCYNLSLYLKYTKNTSMLKVELNCKNYI